MIQLLAKLIIPGKAVGKQRPRVVKGRTFTPGKTLGYEDRIAGIARQQKVRMTEAAVIVAITVERKMPKSWSKKLREKMDGTLHAAVPDLDNVAKCVLDGLNNIAWKDDKQVVHLTIERRNSTEDRTIIHISEVE